MIALGRTQVPGRAVSGCPRVHDAPFVAHVKEAKRVTDFVQDHGAGNLHRPARTDIVDDQRDLARVAPDIRESAGAPLRAVISDKNIDPADDIGTSSVPVSIDAAYCPPV